LLVEDEYGIWIVDHKTHKQLPDIWFRLLDFQSVLYIWAAWNMGIKVRGFIWNYIRTKVPTTPSLAYAGTARERLSTAAIDTDYVTYYLGIKALDRLNDPVAVAKLRELKSQRWEYGKVQTSPFFRREPLEKNGPMIARALASAMRTRDSMHEYGWTDLESVERHTDRSCGWCDYRELCTTELFTGDGSIIRRQQFKVGDPLDYYQDQKDVELIPSS
jgi:hypothetical protein